MEMKFLFILVIPFLFCSCSDSTSPNYDEKAFGIYLLKDTLLITSDAKKISIESIQLQETPIININDIVEYNWEEQVITLTSEAFNRFKGVENKIKSTYGLPFIVVANQQKIYLGNIYPMYSSYIQEDLPYVEVAPFLEMIVSRAPLQSAEDKRKDKRIYSVLNECNKLK